MRSAFVNLGWAVPSDSVTPHSTLCSLSWTTKSLWSVYTLTACCCSKEERVGGRRCLLGVNTSCERHHVFQHSWKVKHNICRFWSRNCDIRWSHFRLQLLSFLLSELSSDLPCPCDNKLIIEKKQLYCHLYIVQQHFVWQHLSNSGKLHYLWG